MQVVLTQGVTKSFFGGKQGNQVFLVSGLLVKFVILITKRLWNISRMFI